MHLTDASLTGKPIAMQAAFLSQHHTSPDCLEYTEVNYLALGNRIVTTTLAHCIELSPVHVQFELAIQKAK
jgi:hypothetical protein